MRALLTTAAKKKLFLLLKEKFQCNSIKELAKKMNTSEKTLDGWFYLRNRYVPQSIIFQEFKGLDIIDRREDNWGQVKGGKLSYRIALHKFGMEEIRRRQSLGGKEAAKTKELSELRKFKVDLQDSLFLEFYGNLLGDGWLSNFFTKNRKVWLIGMCGNLTNDRELIEHYRFLVKELFNRERRVREIHKGNLIVFIFGYKLLLEYLHNELDFPIGKKRDLFIHDAVLALDFDKTKFVIRGIFDTDGSFYLQKNRKGIPSHPIISIHMNAPILISQIGKILSDVGFRVNYSDHGRMIRVQGKKQLRMWLEKIGSSSPYKLGKMQHSID